MANQPQQAKNATGNYMFINKAPDNTNNLCGQRICTERKALHISQRQLAEKLQLMGLDVDKNVIQRIECGKRFVTDIEIAAIARCFRISSDELIDNIKK